MYFLLEFELPVLSLTLNILFIKMFAKYRGKVQVSLMCHLRCSCQCLLIKIFFMALNCETTAGFYLPGREWNLSLLFCRCCVQIWFKNRFFQPVGQFQNFNIYFILKINMKRYSSGVFWGKHIQEGDPFGKNRFFPIKMEWLNIFLIKEEQLNLQLRPFR